MSKKTGGPAFPSEGGQKLMVGNAIHVTLPSQGMTLRDYFAAKAMHAFLSSLAFDDMGYAGMAAIAYDQADAMLAERAK